MLTVYLDESMEAGDSYVVVAGFMGNKSAWVKCARKWRSVLKKYGRTSIHLKELRLKERHRGILKELGEIPASCGLRLVYGGVNVGAYKSSVVGTVMEIASAGYIVAYQIALLAALHKVPKGQQLEVISEHQGEYATRRDNISMACSMMPEFQNPSGNSKLAKWSAIPKSTILEPADFAAFAFLQKLRDSKSLKASLCSPILQNSLTSGKFISDKRTQEILAELVQEDPTFAQPILAPLDKKTLIRQLPTGDEFREGIREVIAEQTKKR
jgi:uncharacterized protein (DUF2249 family)